ncbi:MAG: Calx-beta domain-containing protein, partial [bacterium]
MQALEMCRSPRVSLYQIIAVVLNIFLVCIPAIAQAPPDYSRTPVLFVHGHGLDSGTWQAMINDFITNGYPPEYLFGVDLIPNNGANVRAAEMFIAPAAESLLVRAARAARSAGYTGPPPDRLNIIGHSMGGVSSRWYAAKLRPDRVRTWIALAGANHGTNSLCPFGDEGAREMCPAFATDPVQNKVQIDLNGTTVAPIDETPYGVGMDQPAIVRIPPDITRRILYYSIRIDPDVFIKPESSAIIDGAGGVPVLVPSGVPAIETSPGNYLFTGTTDHDGLPSNPDLIRFVATLLSTSISINDVRVTEGNTGAINAVFTVALSAASNQTVILDYATADGTATAGSDYVAASGTLTFTPGTITQTITVIVNGDLLTEPDEIFF